MKARAAEAKFPFLAANLIDTATGRPVNWPNVRPSVVADIAGIKVGLIGVMTLRALSATIATATGGLRINPLATTLLAEAQSLRRNGADFVVALAHAGVHLVWTDWFGYDFRMGFLLATGLQVMISFIANRPMVFVP